MYSVRNTKMTPNIDTKKSTVSLSVNLAWVQNYKKSTGWWEGCFCLNIYKVVLKKNETGAKEWPTAQRRR